MSVAMNRYNCKNTFQSFEKPVTINFTDKKLLAYVLKQEKPELYL